MTVSFFSILLSAFVLVAPPVHAQENYGDFTMAPLDFLQVTETTQTVGDPAVLWGAPAHVFPFDGLAFTPAAFVSECSAGGSDVTTSVLTMDIRASSGSVILSVSLAEEGEVELTAFPPFGAPTTNASASMAGFLTVTEDLSGPIAPVVIPFVGTFLPTDTFALPGDVGTTAWSGSATIDVAAEVPNATKATLAWDDELTTNCGAGSTSARIQKTAAGPTVELDVTCTSDAKPCPDGTFVERFPPTCQFAPCPTAPLNHFQCYDLRRQTFDRFPLSLSDDLGTNTTVEVRRPKLLCAPVNKRGEDPTAPDDPDHLVGYEIRRLDPSFERILDEEVLDQFVTDLPLVLDLRRPSRLLVPSAKDPNEPAIPLAAPVVDHYQCYDVRGDRRRVNDVTVEDQFGADVTDVKKPSRLCVPVDKTGEGILDNAARLMCYRIKPGPRVNQDVFIDNQIQAGSVRVKRARELCVPIDPPPDTDMDGVPDATDNCPAVANPGQEDVGAAPGEVRVGPVRSFGAGDGVGDACDCPCYDAALIAEVAQLRAGTSSPTRAFSCTDDASQMWLRSGTQAGDFAEGLIMRDTSFCQAGVQDPSPSTIFD